MKCETIKIIIDSPHKADYLTKVTTALVTNK